MIATAALLVALTAGDFSEATVRVEPMADAPPRAASRDGLSLDLETCVHGGCITASQAGGDPSEIVVLAPDQEGPVRVRLHLDCVDAADVRGIARLARVVLVRSGAPLMTCPLEPMDAYCEFPYWEWAPEDDRIVAEYYARGADTSWPAADDTVDEAEIDLGASGLEPGRYELVAAMEPYLVDQYPCERVRSHLFVESAPLRVVVATEEVAQWTATLRDALEATKSHDTKAIANDLATLRGLAESSDSGDLATPQRVDAAVVAALKAGEPNVQAFLDALDATEAWPASR